MIKRVTPFKKSVQFLLGAVLSVMASVTAGNAQTVLINPAGDGGFETGTTFAANGWTVVNNASATMNNWVLNTGATGYTGARAAYISNSTATVPAFSYDNGTNSTVHLYRDVTFPAGETNINFSFSEIQLGESGWDRILVFISNGTPGAAPVVGTPLSDGSTPAITGYTLISTTPVLGTWTNVSVPITAAQAGNTTAAATRRILFVWQNDNSFGGPMSGAIDNVSLTSICNAAIAGQTTSNITLTSATLNWTALTGATGYNVRYKKVSDPVTVGTWATPTNSPTNSLAITGLTNNTNYEFQVAAIGATVCNQYSGSATFATACAGPSLTSTLGATRCGTGSVSLSAVASTGAGAAWYTAASGGTAVFVGSPFVTPAISATTTYYVAPRTPTASPVVNVGSGTTTSSTYDGVFYHLYGGKKSQYLVKASELTAAGATAGDITSLAWEIVSAGTSYAGFNISMKNTTLAAMTTTLQTGLTNVYSNSSVTPTVGYNTYTFSTPFTWDGTSNVIVEVCWSNNNTGGTNATNRTNNPGYVCHAYYRADSQTPASLCGTTTGTSTSSLRPNFRFNMAVCEGVRVPVVATVTTAPTISITSPQSPGICTGSSATITVTSANTNYGYLWSNAQTTPTITVSPTASTYYAVTATDPSTNCVAKDSIRIGVGSVPPVATVTPATATICAGSAATLVATNGGGISTGIIGTGTLVNTATTYPTPFGNYWGSNHEQYLIPATELTAAGVNPGNITALAFYLNTAYGNAGLKDYTIKMAATTLTSMPSSFQATGFTTVYTNTLYTPPAAAGWATTTFSTPFVWNGTSNVLVDISFLNCTTCNGTSSCATTYTNNGIVRQSSTTYTSTYGVYYDDNCTVPTFTPSGIFLTTSISQRPNMQFTGGAPSYPVKWTPVTGLFKDNTLTTAMGAVDTNKTVYASPATTTVYTAQSSDNGCLSAASNNATVTVNPAPPTTVTAGGPVVFCQGGNVVLTGPSGTGLSYVWNLNGVPITPAATSVSYTVTTSGSYTLKVTNANSCSATSSPVVVTVNPAPATNITASGSTIFCTGGSVVLTAPSAPTGSTYAYIWKNNNTAIPGQTAISTTVSTTSNITVTVTNTTTGCSATTPTATVVTSGAPPAAPISAATSSTICQGQSVRLRTNNVPGLSYQWKLGGVDIAGAIDSFYIATAAGNYTVNVNITGAAACSTLSSALAVTVNPLPLASITASNAATTFCQGGSVVLTGNTGTNLAYQWQVGAAPTTPPNTTNVHTATTSGSYTLVVTNTATQCFNTSNAVVVTVNPLPTATITAAGSTSICAGTSVILNANTGTGLTYQWSNGAGPITGATSASYTANASGSYTVKVTNANTCSSTSAATNVTVNPLPPTTVTPSGAVSVCSGSTVTLSGPANPTGLSYQWKLGTTNATGTSTTASYTTGVAGSYKLVLTTAAGCRDSSAATVVTVLPLPTVSMTPTAATTACDSVVLRTTNTGSTYQWNYNNAPIIGATNTSYPATVSGNYSLTNTSVTNGCTATSANVAITINQSPIGEITYSSPLIFCVGGAIVLNTYTGANQTYEWSNNNVVIPGATTPTYITTQSGSYTVKVVNTATTCTRISRPVLVQVNPLPEPVITYNAPIRTLGTTLPYFQYQWYRNNQPIAGFAATRSTYQVIENGAYTVSVTDSNGCTNLAQIYFVNSVGIANTVLGNAVKIYPNPATNVLHIEAPVAVKTVLRDVTGKVIMKTDDARELQVEQLADGMYFLYISTKDGQLIKAEKITKSSHK